MSFILNGLSGTFLSNNEVSVKGYLRTYYIVTHYINGAVNLQPTPADLQDGTNLFSLIFFLVQCLKMCAGMLIIADVNFAPYFTASLILLNNSLFTNPLA